MEKSTKKRVRNVVLGVTSMALVAGITASLTLAYLTDKESKDNVFSNNPSITGILIEPAWDGDTTGDDNQDNETPVDELGKTIANDYTVGADIPKNPQIKNTSNTAEYAAMKVEYKVDLTGAGTYTTVTKDEFAKIATLTISTAWEYIDIYEGAYCYVYGTSGSPTVVAAGGSTTPLFESVKVTTPPAQPVELSDGKILALSDTYTLPKFQIIMNGAVIDTANEDGNSKSAAVMLNELLHK